MSGSTGIGANGGGGRRAPRARRSELATPASSERMCEKASTSGADLVFLDLEDACAPSAKEAARRIAVAALAIVPLQDVLGLGSSARMNTPGRAEGQWRWRCTDAAFIDAGWERLSKLTEEAGRAPH